MKKIDERKNLILKRLKECRIKGPTPDIYKDKLDLFKMTVIKPKRTGLPMVIYIEPGMTDEPKIRISKKYGEKVSPDFFTINFTDNDIEVVDTDFGNIKQRDVNKVIDFVMLNKRILLDFWYDKIDPFDVISNFKKYFDLGIYKGFKAGLFEVEGNSLITGEVLDTGDDLVVIQGFNIEELKQSFEDSVDLYLKKEP